MSSWVVQVLLPATALVLSIPSALVAVRDLRAKSRGQDDLRARGVGTATMWVPPVNTERRSAPPPPPPASPSPPAASPSPQPAPPPAPPASPSPTRSTPTGAHGREPTGAQEGQPTAGASTGVAWVAPLGLWRRTLAYLINFIAVPGLLWTIPGAIGAAVDPVGEQSDELSTGATAGYWVGLTLVAIYAVWNIRRAAVSGRSLGLKVAGGAALDEDTGLPIGVGRVLQRTWWVALACCYVGYLVPLSALGRPDRRTWTDRSARAVVVRFDQRESARRPRPVVARAGPPA